MCGCACTPECVRRSENNLQESVASLYHTDSRDGTQVPRLRSKHPCLLSYLTSLSYTAVHSVVMLGVSHVTRGQARHPPCIEWLAVTVGRSGGLKALFT